MIRRTALVVGGSRGIGRATVTALIERGYQVCAASRSGHGGHGTAAWSAVVDVRDEDSVERLRQQWSDHASGLDLLVVTAGGAVTGRLPEVPPAALTTMLDEHVVGAYRLVRAFRGQLAARHGHVIFLLSRMGRRPRMHGHAYGTAKAALEHLAGCLALDVAADRIRVNCVSPGAVDTDLYRGALPGRDPSTAIAPEEVGVLIAELAGAPFNRVNGAVLDVPAVALADT